MSFSWPYVEPPSKSTTASNNLRLDYDAIETSEIVQQQKIDISKVSKADRLVNLHYNPSKDGLHLYDINLIYT